MTEAMELFVLEMSKKDARIRELETELADVERGYEKLNGAIELAVKMEKERDEALAEAERLRDGIKGMLHREYCEKRGTATCVECVKAIHYAEYSTDMKNRMIWCSTLRNA